MKASWCRGGRRLERAWPARSPDRRVKTRGSHAAKTHHNPSVYVIGGRWRIDGGGRRCFPRVASASRLAGRASRGPACASRPALVASAGLGWAAPRKAQLGLQLRSSATSSCGRLLVDRYKPPRLALPSDNFALFVVIPFTSLNPSLPPRWLWTLKTLLSLSPPGPDCDYFFPLACPPLRRLIPLLPFFISHISGYFSHF